MPTAIYEAVDFASLPHWQDGAGQREAIVAFAESREAFRISAEMPVAAERRELIARLVDLSAQAAVLADGGCDDEQARLFFEQHFRPHRVIHSESQGLLTGYYEPVVRAARTRSAQFCSPLFLRPPDLVDLTKDRALTVDGVPFSHARMNADTLEPYPARAEIEKGCLNALELEFAYLEDPVDAYFMQVQGSGVLKFSDDEFIRIGYDGKNGHPYTSIGRLLIDQGVIAPEDMSLQSLGEWLRADLKRGQALMRANSSFVFFKELGRAEDVRATGVYDTPLKAGTSLAVDQTFHQIGIPVFVSSDSLGHAPWCPGAFQRLMIAQDVGSAIVGPERGDVFFGSGDQAGATAGITANMGNFTVLLPKELSA